MTRGQLPVCAAWALSDASCPLDLGPECRSDPRADTQPATAPRAGTPQCIYLAPAWQAAGRAVSVLGLLRL